MLLTKEAAEALKAVSDDVMAAALYGKTIALHILAKQIAKNRVAKMGSRDIQLWFILFLRNSWAAVPTFIEKMYGIVRGRLLPNIEEIVALMARDI